MSQLFVDLNVQIPEEHPGDYPPYSPTTEAVLPPSGLVWADDVEQEAP